MRVGLMESLPVAARYAPFNCGHSSHPRFAQASAANLWTDSGKLMPPSRLECRASRRVANAKRHELCARMLASQRTVGEESSECEVCRACTSAALENAAHSAFRDSDSTLRREV